MASGTVQIQLRQQPSMERNTEAHTFEQTSLDGSIKKQIRPKSASYAALRSAVFQLTCLSDFTREKIGSGFFADVYKVKHKVSDEVMVLKMNKSKKTSKQMLSEIQLMNRLSHPNILRFKGSCVHEGQLHALTEFINGGSLEDLLHDRNVELSWSVRIKIARDIARGMAYLHSRGIFHRDLNSRNCLIQKHPNGNLTTIVADFGLAAKIKQRKLKSYTETVGSPYWMAPECLNGKQYCELADVFSFGITLAEIMTRMPADPDFIPRTSHFGVNCEAMRQLCVGCPEDLFQLMSSCCQLDPDDRPSFEEVVEILKAIPISIDDTASVEQPPDTTDDVYLRSCFSEPFLKLTDQPDSGGSSVHIGYRLDSIGSSTASTGSSCCSCNEDLKVVSDVPTSEQNSTIPLTRTVATSNLDLVNKAAVDDIDGVLGSNSENSFDQSSYRESKKTSSLTLTDNDNNSPNLNCSIQTLIAEDSQVTTELVNGGGDSGIDPGEMEVFKFPPYDNHSTKCKRSPNFASRLENAIKEGDQTPVYSSPYHQEATRKLIPEAFSPHGLSPVRTPSDGSVSCTYTTPTSPYAQSWASSELSFHLPNPSTPYAPPCTPVPRLRRTNSCPSSPNLHSKSFRFSLDSSHFNVSSVDSDSPASYHRRSQWANSKNSTDQDSLDADVEYALRHRKHSHDPIRRSVHFEDDEICTNLDKEHFSKMSLSRNRSHSSPAQPIMKHSSTSFIPLANCKENTVYSLTLADCNDTQACSKYPNSVLCKGYNITMSSNARLSSSVPNLFNGNRFNFL